MNKLGNKKVNSYGITLVALVVTIVVLLILAGITIMYVMGDNSIFRQAQEAKLKTEIAKWKEMLETAKTPIIVEGLGKFNPDKYFKYIEEQGIIEDKEKDVVDNGDGTYDVTTKPGYIFEVELIPSKEDSTDAKIEYIGQAGKIAPMIKRIEVSATSTSITGKAIVSRLGNGTVTYYYKLKSADDDSYTEITNVNEEIGATQSTGITAGEEYVIKVVAKNEAGETVSTEEIRATKVFVENITLSKTEEVVAVGKAVTLTATVKPDDATNKNVKWESNDPSVVTVDENGVISGKTAGIATITVSATDGSNMKADCTVTVKSISLNKIATTIQKKETETLIATVLPVNATSKSVIWSSNDTTVATVNGSGVVTGLKAGTATITASTTDANKTIAVCKVTVEGSSLEKIVGSIQTSNKTVTDDYGNKVVVPGGFKVIANGTGDVTYSYNGDGSPSVQDGVVIQDSEGNQFVWIPVGSIKNKNGTSTTITLGRYTFDTTKGTPTLQQNATNYSQIVSIAVSNGMGDCQELTSNSQNTAAKSLSTFVSKTKANGGYYLGRYEASRGSDGKVDSQANKTVWNRISQPEAATAARNMYDNSYVTSDLTNSYSWDTAIVFIQKYSGNTNYANKEFVNTSVEDTGKAGNKVCNIHDMGANCVEWSTEHCTDTLNTCVFRTVCRRSNTTMTRRSERDSFRPLLYLK